MFNPQVGARFPHSDSSFEYLGCLATVLLKILATDSYMGLVEAIFMFCVGHSAAVPRRNPTKLIAEV
ncbi:hypothetical protein, partial [Trueperella pyogenes]